MTSGLEGHLRDKLLYPGIRVTANGNQLVSYHTETRITDAGIFYPITPSTEGGELYQQAYAEGKPIREVAARETSLPREQLDALLDPAELTRGGIKGGSGGGG